jgi:hypothetical protein
MRITESQLRKVIRDVIKESLELDSYLYDPKTGERLSPMKKHDLEALDNAIADKHGPNPYAAVEAHTAVTFDGKYFHYGNSIYDNFDDLGEFTNVSEDAAREAIESYCKSQGLSDVECADMRYEYVGQWT